MSVAPPPSASRAPSPRARARLRTTLLAIGDAYVLLVFALLGLLQHHATIPAGPGNAVGAWVLTAAPFALGWFLVAPWLGAYRMARTDTVLRMLRTTLLAWLAAWPATLVLRWAFTGRVPPLSFAVVILLANAVLLGLYRSWFTVLERRRAAWGDAGARERYPRNR